MGRGPNLMNDQVISQQHSPEAPTHTYMAWVPPIFTLSQSDKPPRTSRISFLPLTYTPVSRSNCTNPNPDLDYNTVYLYNMAVMVQNI